MQRLDSLTPLPATQGHFQSHRVKVHYTRFLPFLINKSSVFRKESSKGTPFEVKSLRYKKGFMPS